MRASRDLKTFVLLHQGRSIVSVIETIDETRNSLWRLDADKEAFVSADGNRILAAIDLKQKKDLEDEQGPIEREMRLLSRDGRRIATFPGYPQAVALSDDGSRMWLRKGLTLTCLNEKGEALAEIAVNSVDWSRVLLSRRLDYVVIANQEYARTTAVEWYGIPPPCRN